jgi:Xaa-Pro dipeptidase
MTNKTEYIPQLSRQQKLNSILSAAGLDAMVLNPGPSLVYLTGLHFHLSERPVAVFIVPGRDLTIVLPELEQEKLKHLPFSLQAFPYGEDPATCLNALRNAVHAAKLPSSRIGVEPNQLRYLEYHLLSEAAPKADFIPAEESVASLRMYKDSDELSAMRQAVDIAERALQATLTQVKIGLTERDLAAALTVQLLRAGCDPELPFSPIVSAGPNSANPHATPSARELTPGDLLVIDWGASLAGYFSDITRTFAIGKLDLEFEKISQVVLEANETGRQAARPGVAAEEIDHAARKVIEVAGYGQYFTHRTGHGLGMEAHEQPYIRAGNLQQLEPGMTFTVEPGIYMPGRNGVRIEDDVVITESGSESLTHLPREVKQLI